MRKLFDALGRVFSFSFLYLGRYLVPLLYFAPFLLYNLFLFKITTLANKRLEEAWEWSRGMTRVIPCWKSLTQLLKSGMALKENSVYNCILVFYVENLGFLDGKVSNKGIIENRKHKISFWNIWQVKKETPTFLSAINFLFDMRQVILRNDHSGKLTILMKNDIYWCLTQIRCIYFATRSHLDISKY